MARVLEHVGKELLRKNSVPTPDFLVASNAGQARQAADELGYPVVIKALVPVGKRGKAGAVKLAASAEEAVLMAQEILSMAIRGFPVEQVLVEEKLDIDEELYASITFDPSERMPVVVVSRAGGMDIEETAQRHPEKVVKRHVDLWRGFQPYQAKEMWSDLKLTGGSLRKAAPVLWRLWNVFQKYDATILEINPLALTADGDCVAAAVLMGIDDDALYRQPELAGRVQVGSDRAWRPLTALEKEMIAVDQSESYRGTAKYTEMEGGDIGFLCGGGGGSLLCYDTLLRYGGQPANYTEFGGNPTENKVAGLVKGVLSKPGVKGLFVCGNITNNTQTDVVARGIARAFKELGIDPQRFPTLGRLAGVNDSEAAKIHSEAGIEYHKDDITMEDAARLMVDKMKKAYAEEVG